MRLFTAIGAQGLNFDPKMAFKKVKTNLLKKEIEHRWVPVDNYHCTLNFLGEVPAERVEELIELLGFISRSHQEFTLKIQDLDAFPEIHLGRVIWVGVQNSKELRALQADCLKKIKEGHFPCEERPYIPHLTVARLRNPRNLRDILSPLKNTNFGLLKVQKISLYESQSGELFRCTRRWQVFRYLPMYEDRNLM